VGLEYDPWRGGFCLLLGPAFLEKAISAFGGLVSVYFDEQGRVAKIESFWDHGGLPLRGIHHSVSYLQGDFPIKGAELDISSLQLRQSAEKLQLWFSSGNDLPRDHWTSKQDAEVGITLWFSKQKAQAGWPVPGIGGRAACLLVSGIELEVPRPAVTAAITSLRLWASDFK